MTNTKILVTGAAGYIGGQTMLSLLDAGYDVLAIDYRPLPEHLEFCHNKIKFYLQDFASTNALTWIVENKPDAIIHCAGSSLVGPSLGSPAEYYSNNTMKTMALINTVTEALPNTRIIFSSSAAVYGVPVMTPCHEVDPCEPISPYGESKRMIEQIMASYNRAYKLDYVALRYFNACGADSLGRHGQGHNATHIIARILEAIKYNDYFTLHGTNYPTSDGTCIRDYVHVEDIARAHILAINREIPAGVYNLGSNQGHSNREILKLAQTITNQTVLTVEGEERVGDPPVLTANDDKFTQHVGSWRKFNINDMISHAWAWYNK